ncbi:MAG TPA: hypothetical protein VGX78_15145, partial [Pirellulales bacterium]|nr:hypothetical protein [Pirellulales bacterium]
PSPFQPTERHLLPVERVTPILMTAATTALGLLPLVILGERPGNEIEHSMAIDPHGVDKPCATSPPQRSLFRL